MSLYFILSKLEAFKANLSILVNSSYLRHYTNLGVYHTRMYTLIKINNSEGYYRNYTNIEIEKIGRNILKICMINYRMTFF